MLYKLLLRLHLVPKPSFLKAMWRIDELRQHNIQATSALNGMPDSLQTRRLRFHLKKQLEAFHKLETDYENGDL